MRFTNNDKLRGEKLVSHLSEKAQMYYFGTDPLYVYQTADGRIYGDLCGEICKYDSLEHIQADFETMYDEGMVF